MNSVAGFRSASISSASSSTTSSARTRVVLSKRVGGRKFEPRPDGLARSSPMWTCYHGSRGNGNPNDLARHEVTRFAPSRMMVQLSQREGITMTAPRETSGNKQISASGHDLTPPTRAELETMAATLTPEERRVILNQGTEPPFCGGLLDNKSQGVYECRLCKLPLFAPRPSSSREPAGRAYARSTRSRGGDPRHQPRNGPHRDPVCALRRAPRSRLRGRPATHRPAPLPELGLASIHRERETVAITLRVMKALTLKAPCTSPQPAHTTSREDCLLL